VCEQEQQLQPQTKSTCGGWSRSAAGVAGDWSHHLRLSR